MAALDKEFEHVGVVVEVVDAFVFGEERDTYSTSVQFCSMALRLYSVCKGTIFNRASEISRRMGLSRFNTPENSSSGSTSPTPEIKAMPTRLDSSR